MNGCRVLGSVDPALNDHKWVSAAAERLTAA